MSGVHTHVRDGQLTLAGLRGGRAARLAETLGVVDQVRDDAWQLLRTGELSNG